jgi:hypothetical protein
VSRDFLWIKTPNYHRRIFAMSHSIPFRLKVRSAYFFSKKIND